MKIKKLYAAILLLNPNFLEKSCTICMSSTYRKVFPRVFRLSISLLFLTIVKSISRHNINKQADTGSPCQAPSSSLKHFVVTPPFITHDSCSFKNILIQSMKLVPKPNFYNAVIKKLWPKESKAFSISIVTK